MPTLEEVYGAPVKPTQIFGDKPATIVDRGSLAGISLQDMGVNPQSTSETQADEGFFKRSGRAIADFEVGSFQHPIQNLSGVAKGLAAGAVTMGELAAKGVAGLVTATVGKGFDAGPEAVDAWLAADREASKGILYINLAPANRQEEAFQKFLGIIPDAITAAGDTVYEKTGSALAGAGSQALLTLLTMKPSVAGKVLNGPLKLSKGELTSSKSTKSAEKVQTAFDELAVKDPQGATALAEHVIEADPDLGLHLMKSIDDAGRISPEELGRKAASSTSDLPRAEVKGLAADQINQSRDLADQLGLSSEVERLTYEGQTAQQITNTLDAKLDRVKAQAKANGENPNAAARNFIREVRVSLKIPSLDDAPKEVAAWKADYEARQQSAKTQPKESDPIEGMRKATQEFHQVLEEAGQTPDIPKIGEVARAAQSKLANAEAARQAVKEELKHVSHSVDETGSHVVTTAGGELLAQENGKYLQVKRIDVPKELRGYGVARAMVSRLVEEAGKKGLRAASDVTVSADAQKVYRALREKGYTVRENPSTINKETGSRVSNDPRVPVYEVYRKPWNAPKATFKPPDPILYMDAGHPVTRSSVERAFLFGKSISDLPGIRLVTGKLTEYYRQLIHTVNPEALGPEAKVGASILAKHIATQMQKDSSQFHRAGERISFWNHQPHEQVIAFIKGFEKGKKFTDPVLQKAADGYRQWNDSIYKSDTKLGIEYEPVENYLYHVFEDSPGVAQFFQKQFGPKWNNPGFIKDRSFDLYAQAMKAGYKPRFTNPEEIMLARQHASNIAEMRVNALEEMKTAGLATEVASGGKNRPEGFPATEWRSPTGQRYWVHDSASAVLHNAFNTQSLWNLKGIAGDAFRSAMFLKNTIVPIKLALSLFHPLHVLTIDNATGMVRATKELLSGTKSPASFVADMAKSTLYADIYSSPKTGYHLLNAFKGKLPEKSITAADTLSLQYMAEGGFIPEMSSQYRIGAIAKFKSAIQRRSAAAAWHLPFAAIESLQRPMFEVWIPSLKIASYLKDVSSAIKTDPTLLDNPLKRQLAFRKLAKSVDNRYGEMAYNTLFWNRWVKDLAVANTLSLGWQMGFIREYGGGMMDLGHTVTKQGSVVEKAKSGMLDRPLFVTYYTTQALAYGGLMTWALSGQSPQSLYDYIYPKTGETQDNGRPERVNTMFYPREFASIYKHMENEGVVNGLGHLAGSKASGVLGMTREWATGINSFDQEIRDPDGSTYKQVEQTLASTLLNLEPISVKTLSESEGGEKAAALAFSGFGPAPKYVTETKTEGLIKGTFRKYVSPRLTPFDKAQLSSEKKELKKAYMDGDSEKYGEILDRLRDKYQLTGKEQQKLERSLGKNTDALGDMFARLGWKQQKKILDQMTDDEREIYLPRSNKDHLRTAYEPPEKR